MGMGIGMLVLQCAAEFEYRWNVGLQNVRLTSFQFARQPLLLYGKGRHRHTAWALMDYWLWTRKLEFDTKFNSLANYVDLVLVFIHLSW